MSNSVAKHDENEKTKHMQTCEMQGTEPKAPNATLLKHGKDEIWHATTQFPTLK